MGCNKKQECLTLQSLQMFGYMLEFLDPVLFLSLQTDPAPHKQTPPQFKGLKQSYKSKKSPILHMCKGE